MLAPLCHRLAADGWFVSLIGRDPTKLARAAGDDLRINPISVDYRDSRTFRTRLEDARQGFGNIVLTVCWIRSWEPRALEVAADATAPGGRLLHVRGSTASDDSDSVIAELEDRPGLVYQEVILGVIDDGKGQRWLTDQEISAGVYAAISEGRSRAIVGRLYGER